MDRTKAAINFLALLMSFAFAFEAACAQSSASPPVIVVEERAYIQPNTREIVVRSPTLERNFVILVSAPTGPFVEPGKKLPAIYALDGGYGIAGPIGQLMSWSGAMSPAYIVSLSHPPGDSHRDYDFLHRPTSRDGTTIGGGGAAFERFLARELRPLLESRFPLDPEAAVLFGHSLAGIFAANVLASAPESFASFIIASPSTWADPQTVAAVGKVAHRGLNRRVFIAAGQHEARIVEGAEQLAAVLKGEKSTFRPVVRIFADATHISYLPDLVPAAYVHVLPPTAKATVKRVAVTLDRDKLERIAGVYAIGDGRTITISVNGSRAFAVLTGTPQTEILAASPQLFFAPVEGFDVTFTFEGSADEPAQTVVLSLNGAKTRARRTDR